MHVAGQDDVVTGSTRVAEVNNIEWYGMVAPAGTSADVVKRIREAAVKRELELRKRIAMEQNIRLTE